MTAGAALGGPESSTRVRALDSIRFVCAVWVLIGHAGPLPFVESIGRSTPIRFLATGILHNLVSGPAAVIVFFVISGFCIHLPYRRAPSVDLLPYYSRRYIRILVPAVAAVVIGKLAGVDLRLFRGSILWSLVCEEIYYLLYPALRKAAARLGWPRLIALAYVVACGVTLTNPIAGDYASFGDALNWMVGLPCWLLGCHVAERWGTIAASPSPPSAELWAWRGGILAASVLASALRFHTPATHPWTLNLFALLAMFWISREIVPPSAPQLRSSLVSRGGRFSYSIYLVHLIGLALGGLLGLDARLPPPFAWVARILLAVLVSYAFYAAVEEPSHRLARATAGRFARAGQPALAH